MSIFVPVLPALAPTMEAEARHWSVRLEHRHLDAESLGDWSAAFVQIRGDGSDHVQVREGAIDTPGQAHHRSLPFSDAMRMVEQRAESGWLPCTGSLATPPVAIPKRIRDLPAPFDQTTRIAPDADGRPCFVDGQGAPLLHPTSDGLREALEQVPELRLIIDYSLLMQLGCA
jgi:hypothetical protein